MSADVLIANLLRVAKEDLDGARLLAAASNRNAVYLFEQSGEKIIRAVLTSENQHAGRSHLLNDLVDLVPDANPLKPLLRKIEHLAAYATAYRYPSPAGKIKGTPSSQDLTTYAADVEKALNEAALRFGVDLQTKDTPAKNPGPAR